MTVNGRAMGKEDDREEEADGHRLLAVGLGILPLHWSAARRARLVPWSGIRGLQASIFRAISWGASGVGLNRTQFEEELLRRKLPIYRLEVTDLADDLSTLDRLRLKMNE
jgi:hypothetical protein